jgi:hypothetical protein
MPKVEEFYHFKKTERERHYNFRHFSSFLILAHLSFEHFEME